MTWGEQNAKCRSNILVGRNKQFTETVCLWVCRNWCHTSFKLSQIQFTELESVTNNQARGGPKKKKKKIDANT